MYSIVSSPTKVPRKGMSQLWLRMPLLSNRINRAEQDPSKHDTLTIAAVTETCMNRGNGGTSLLPVVQNMDIILKQPSNQDISHLATEAFRDIAVVITEEEEKHLRAVVRHTKL